MAKKEHTYESIISDIRARRFSPVYILMGEEPYFIDKITDLLLDTVVNESERDFNQLVMYGADSEVVDVLNAAKRFPMMSEYQLVVVKEAQLLDRIELLLSYVANPLKTTILVINYKYKTIDKRRSLITAAEKVGIVFDSRKIPDYKMPSFITGVLQERRLDIDQKATQMLADYIGNDLGRLMKELDKLAIILAEKKASRITPEIIEQNVGISKNYNNFELVKALATKDVLKANRIIQYFEKNPKSNPLVMILPVIFNYFTNLFICYYEKDKSETGLMNALNIHNSYFVKDYVTGMRNYSAMKVFRIISLIRETDARSKGIGNVSVTDGDLLKELIYSILH